jgi:hypothetical protein
VLLPLAILVAMISGIVYQQHNHPTASGSTMPPKK